MEDRCPRCGGTRDGGIMCGNGCGTRFCGRCRREWHVARGREVVGHDPECGVIIPEPGRGWQAPLKPRQPGQQREEWLQTLWKI